MSGNFWSPVQLSLQVAVISSIFVFVVGIILARMMSRVQFTGKVIIETVLLLPLVLPPTVVGFLLIIVFGKNSIAGSTIEFFFHQPLMFTWWAAVIASTVVAFPLMYQSAKTGFQSVDREIEDASRVDGAGEWKVFLLVTFPLSLKSILSGGILSFARALGEFGATLMFAGNIPGKTQTTPMAIYVAMESANLGMAWLWVLSMILLSFFMLLATTLIK